MPIPEGLDLGDDDYVDAQITDTDLDLDGEQLGVSDEGVEGQDAEPERQYLNLDEVADRYIKVGDEDILVRDLPAGFMKNKDYTQKTQELAQQRQLVDWANALQAAMDEDFDGTVDYLRPVWSKGPAPVQSNPDLDSDDPLVREIAQLKAWQANEVTRQKQSEVSNIRMQIAQEAQAVEAAHGADFLQEAIALASQRGGTLTDAAELLEGRKLKQWVEAEKAKAARVDAKRNDAVITTGGSRRMVEPGDEDYSDLGKAIKAAMRKHSVG